MVTPLRRSPRLAEKRAATIRASALSALWPNGAPEPAARSRRPSPRRRKRKVVAKAIKISVPYIVGHRELTLLEAGVLTVAAYPHFFPVCYHDASGDLAGLDVDIMKRFAAQAGIQVRFVEFDEFNGIWDKPANRDADVAIGGIANSKGRGGATTEWTIPYFYVHRSAMFLKSNPIKRFPQDVHGVLVGTFGSTGWVDGEIRLESEHKQALMVRGTTDEEDVQKLLSGEIQGLMRGDFVSRAIIHEHPEVSMISWEAEPSILPKDGEIFAYPTLAGSGVATMLSVFITELIDRKQLGAIMKEHHLL